MDILPADFADPQILDLLRVHLAGMQSHTPPEYAHALDLSGLQAPEISFYAAWDGAALLGFGALKALSPTSGEVKSMRTHPAQLRKGVAAALLDHLVAAARERDYERLSLETGVGPEFEPALALYRRFGFRDGPVFGAYQDSPYNQFLHLAL